MADRDPMAKVFGQFETLGLVSAEVATITENGYSPLGRVAEERPARRYSPSATGKAALKELSFVGLRGYCFRYAQAEIVEISEWTEPAPALGQLVSQVRFTVRPKDVLPWVQAAAFGEAFPKERAKLETNTPTELRAALSKTNHGWRPVSIGGH